MRYFAFTHFSIDLLCRCHCRDAIAVASGFDDSISRIYLPFNFATIYSIYHCTRLYRGAQRASSLNTRRRYCRSSPQLLFIVLYRTRRAMLPLPYIANITQSQTDDTTATTHFVDGDCARSIICA
jgi:hypothetical protein